MRKNSCLKRKILSRFPIKSRKSIIQEAPPQIINISAISNNNEEIEGITDENNEKMPKIIKNSVKKTNDETIVLLNLFTNVSNCLKHTLPVLLQEDNNNNTSNLASNEEKFDLGSIFYPNFNKIMSDLIEFSPILTKKIEIKSLHNYVDFMYQMTIFAFRFKSTNSGHSINNNISSVKLESSSNKVKSLQDHVNEIMLSSSIFIYFY